MKLPLKINFSTSDGSIHCLHILNLFKLLRDLLNSCRHAWSLDRFGCLLPLLLHTFVLILPGEYFLIFLGTLVPRNLASLSRELASPACFIFWSLRLRHYLPTMYLLFHLISNPIPFLPDWVLLLTELLLSCELFLPFLPFNMCRLNPISHVIDLWGIQLLPLQIIP